jgi:hypothetical protein
VVKKWVIEDRVGDVEGREERKEKGAGWAAFVVSIAVSGVGGSTTIDTSPSPPPLSSSAGKTNPPSPTSLNIRLTAMIPAAPVRADKSAPTYPGVSFAKALKSNEPSKRSFAQRTFRILHDHNELPKKGRGKKKNALSPPLLIRNAHTDLMIKPPRSSERSVERIGAVSSADYDDWFVGCFVP